ncbi:MAG TPA: hypothetical protein VGE35_00980 [Candidatus Paceibacterota bacterium]
MDKVDIQEQLTKLRSQEYNLVSQQRQAHVIERVFENLIILLPPGMRVDQAKMNIFGFAIQQLCKAPSVDQIDWLALNDLAADIIVIAGANSPTSTS